MDNSNVGKKRLCIGIVAHVDAGKTTLSEGLLYTAGSIRKMGRVDNRDAFLDTYALERERGITIFSKQAELELEHSQITLLDTPGHVDFSAEMERTLQVLDAAILVISGADGVQGHTKTLWHLLMKYNIPVFLFVNKMDQNGTEPEQLLAHLKKELSDSCVDFQKRQADPDVFYEEVAMCEESMLNEYLENQTIPTDLIARAVCNRKVFPVYFGSALKLQGVDDLIAGIENYMLEKAYPEQFGAKVYKISRDDQGKRLTHLKITGGCLKVRDSLGRRMNDNTVAVQNVDATEKVNQIRIYHGEKFQTVNEVQAGQVCAVTGLTETRPGQGYGIEEASSAPLLAPVLTYQIILPDGCDPAVMLPKLRQLEEEDPELHIVWNEQLQEIQAQLMGEVQIEILKSLIKERFGIEVAFGNGAIVYKETIADTVEGVGHFEPLRHYAEVHLLMEPGEAGSGLIIGADCSEDMLDKNWQRLILTHLLEREHIGVLTGSPITDMKITLVGGRAHQKHTEGGDFREATYRAIRQGLKEARSVLLEPFYDYVLELPQANVGRAMADIERMHGTFELEHSGEELVTITGYAPVMTMRDYQKEVVAYTKGYGRLSLNLRGYEPCHNADEIIAAVGYDSERDLYNPTGSVFCAHGSGYLVSWDKVKKHMHVESYLKPEKVDDQMPDIPERAKSKLDDWIAQEEIDQIFSDTFYKNRRDKSVPRNSMYKKRHTRLSSAGLDSSPVVRTYNREPDAEHFLLVDGYNIIFAWEELNELSKVNIDSARGRLLDILCNYQGIKQCNLIVVFDAYRVQGHETEVMEYHNIHVVYTKEAETADQYIEKFAHEHGRKHYVTVATSDGLEQIIIRGQGCMLVSAREFEKEVKQAEQALRENHLEQQPLDRHRLADAIPEETWKQMQQIVSEDEEL